MEINYASRIKEAKPSIIRELLKLSADPSLISFAGGNPDADLFPAAEIREACMTVLETQGQGALQYSPTEGNTKLRQIISDIMKGLEVVSDIDNILITSGSQQGLDLTGKLFIDPGDVIICESPSYMGALNAFRFYSPKFVDVEMDENGMCTDDLERKLIENPDTKFIYTIPDFQNPTGRTTSRERRIQMVELAVKYRVPIIEDSPYISLRYRGESVPPIKYFDTHGIVVYLGSFSKIFCPGIRVGWIQGSPDIIKKYVVLKQASDLHTNELTQREVAQYLQTNNLDEHIIRINDTYKKKKDLMIKKMEELFPKQIKFENPDGGLFIWLELPEGYNSEEIFETMINEQKVAYVPGSTFFSGGGHLNTIRLSFATMPEAKIVEGIERMSKVFNKIFA